MKYTSYIFICCLHNTLKRKKSMRSIPRPFPERTRDCAVGWYEHFYNSTFASGPSLAPNNLVSFHHLPVFLMGELLLYHIHAVYSSTSSPEIRRNDIFHVCSIYWGNTSARLSLLFLGSVFDFRIDNHSHGLVDGMHVYCCTYTTLGPLPAFILRVSKLVRMCCLLPSIPDPRSG